MDSVTFWIVLFTVLAALTVYVTFAVMGRASKGYDKAKQRRIDRGPAVPCSTCESTMEFIGLQEFALGDLGAAADLGASDGALPLEVHRCPTCRKVELFLPPSAG